LDQWSIFFNIKAAVGPSVPLASWNPESQLVDMGTSQFWAVPYALFASNVAGLDLKMNISDSSSMLKPYLRKSDTAAMLAPYLAKLNTTVQYADTAVMLKNYQAALNGQQSNKVNTSDTAAMLRNYLSAINILRANKLNAADTAAMLSNYLSAINSLRANKLNAADTAAMLSNYLSALHSLRGNKVNYADTAAMLSNYLSGINLLRANKLNLADTAAMLSNYLSAINSLRANKLNIADTASMLSNYLGALHSIRSTYLPLTGGSLTGSLTGTNVILTGSLTGTNAVFSGSLTAGSIKIPSGSATQFLKADGSLDASNYLTSGVAGTTYLPLAGGTMTGTLNATNINAASALLSGTMTANGFQKTGGVSTQFLKADGSVDNSDYLTISNGGSTYLPLSGGTLTGSLNGTSFIKSGGLSTQFLKADGTIDATAYLPLSGGILTGSLTGTNAVLNGDLTATTVKIPTGTSSQFLKADGTLDANNYVTTATAGATYLPLAGGTLTGDLTGASANMSGNLKAASFRTPTGTALQFLKADGSIDNNDYLTTGTAGTTYLPLSGGTLTGTLNGTTAILSGNSKAAGFQTPSGTATQFLKADGSVDAENYLSTTLAGTTYLPLSGGTLTGAINGTNLVLSGDVLANSVKKNGGTAFQFLMADGSVNTNNYLLSSAANFLPLNGGTLTGTLNGTAAVFGNEISAPNFKIPGGTSTQFLKADGTVDANNYLTTASAAGNYLPLTGGSLSGTFNGTNAFLSGGITATAFQKQAVVLLSF